MTEWVILGRRVKLGNDDRTNKNQNCFEKTESAINRPFKVGNHDESAETECAFFHAGDISLEGWEPYLYFVDKFISGLLVFCEKSYVGSFVWLLNVFK